ncbi:MAG: hypothetical protein ABH845_01805 [Candidatus Omnitrophota bacterium]
MRRSIPYLTLFLFLLGQAASSEADFLFEGLHLSAKAHLRARAASDGGVAKSLASELTGRPEGTLPKLSARDGAVKEVVALTDPGWKVITLGRKPQNPDEVAAAIDRYNVKYIVHEWMLAPPAGWVRENLSAGTVQVQIKGNLIVVGPATRSLLEVGIPTDRSSLYSGFGEADVPIYSSDGVISLDPSSFWIYEHPDVPYRIARISGSVFPTKTLADERKPLQETYGFEKSLEPLIPVTASRAEAIEKVMMALVQRGTRRVALFIPNESADLKEVEFDVSSQGRQSEFRRALEGHPIVPLGESAEVLLTDRSGASYFAAPDPYTLMVDPFDPERMMIMSEAVTEEGVPFENDPRYRMRAYLQKLWKENHLIPVVGLEPEWFLISRDLDGNPIPTDSNRYYDSFLVHPPETQEVLLNAIEALSAVGIQITNTTSEVSGAQHEWVIEAKFPPKQIDPGMIGQDLPYQYLSALRTLDAFMVYKYILQKAAQREGEEITFEAKPFQGVNGSGMHTHLSFWMSDSAGKLINLFSDPSNPTELSPIGSSAAEGVMRAGREMTIFTNQRPGDWGRFEPGYEAPIFTGFISKENRSASVRVPMATSSSGARFEYRVPTAGNMYLGTGVILSAAHLGMDRHFGIRKLVKGQDIYQLASEEPDTLLQYLPPGADLKSVTVPVGFKEAINLAKASFESGIVKDLIREGFLTESLVTTYLQTKKEQAVQPVRTPFPFQDARRKLAAGNVLGNPRFLNAYREFAQVAGRLLGLTGNRNGPFVITEGELPSEGEVLEKVAALEDSFGKVISTEFFEVSLPYDLDKLYFVVKEGIHKIKITSEMPEENRGEKALEQLVSSLLGNLQSFYANLSSYSGKSALVAARDGGMKENAGKVLNDDAFSGAVRRVRRLAVADLQKTENPRIVAMGRAEELTRQLGVIQNTVGGGFGAGLPLDVRTDLDTLTASVSAAVSALADDVSRADQTSLTRKLEAVTGSVANLESALSRHAGRVVGATAGDGGVRNALADYTPGEINELLVAELAGFKRGVGKSVLESGQMGTIAVYEGALNNLTIAKQIEAVARQLKEAKSGIGFSLVSTSGDSEEEIVEALFRDSNGAVDLRGLFQATVDVSIRKPVISGTADEASEIEGLGLQEYQAPPLKVKTQLEDEHGLPLLELIAPKKVVEAFQAGNQSGDIPLYASLVSRNPKAEEAGIANGTGAVLQMVELLGLPEADREKLLQAGGQAFTVEVIRVGEELEEVDTFYRMNRGV